MRQRQAKKLCNKTYHSERINNDRVNVRASRLIGNVTNVADDDRLEAKLADTVRDARTVVHGIHVQDRALLERLHLRNHRLGRGRTDLRGDSEEEPRALADFGLNPHVALHKRDQTFRDR